MANLQGYIAKLEIFTFFCGLHFLNLLDTYLPEEVCTKQNANRCKTYVQTNTDLCSRIQLQESMRTYVDADPNEDDYASARLIALVGWKKNGSVLLDFHGPIAERED